MGVLPPKVYFPEHVGVEHLFIKHFFEGSLAEFPHKPGLILISDHRRIAELMALKFPKRYKVGMPDSKDDKVSHFLTAIYSMQERDYESLYMLTDQITNTNWWKRVKSAHRCLPPVDKKKD